MRRTKSRLTLFVVILFSGCTPASEDPADGGFLNGISGIQSGVYQERTDELEATRSEEAARTVELQEELARLEGELAGLRAEIARLQSRLASSGQTVPTDLSARVANLETPNANAPDRLERLRQSVMEARDIATSLSQLEA